MDFFDHSKIDRVDRPQVMRVQSRQMEFRKVSTWRRQHGHTIFKFNTKTKEIAPAEIENEAFINMQRQVFTHGKIIIEKDCIYIEALNRKNVIKHLKREGLL